MREILFKAKSVEYGKWLEGYYLKKYDFLGKEVHFIFLEYRPNAWRCIEVNPDTICQFTGLCDKNGKKIWENDILMAHLDESYPEDATYEAVEWGVAGWVTHEANSIDRQYIGEFDLEHYEVVGNVFDNPELLQEGTK